MGVLHKKVGPAQSIKTHGAKRRGHSEKSITHGAWRLPAVGRHGAKSMVLIRSLGH
jgi:hypothetical protein